MYRQADANQVIAFVVAIAVLALPSRAANVGGQVGVEPASKPTLKERIEAYFRAGDARERTEAAAEVERAAGGDIDKVARELGGIHLWPDHPTSGEWNISVPSGESIDVLFRFPLESKSDQAVPLIVVMPSPGDSAPDALKSAIQTIGPPGQGHAWVAPKKEIGGSFHQPIAAAGDLPYLMREIRKRIHVDTDRIYFFGLGKGGEAAWMAAIMYPDEFAGVVAVSAYPRIPYPEQSYALLLPNLRELPVLTVWHAPTPSADSDVSPTAGFNRAIVEYAKRVSLPIVGVELSDDSDPADRLPEKETETILSRRHSAIRLQVRHWFRYPAQSDCGWLRATDWAGDVWSDDQLSIATAPTADRDRFITDTIAEKLAFVGGHIKGQIITIETRRCGGVELRLSPGQADFSKPITIVCNGRKRFEGLIRPSVSDLLESTFESRDFLHPVYARKKFAIRTDSPVGAP